MRTPGARSTRKTPHAQAPEPDPVLSAAARTESENTAASPPRVHGALFQHLARFQAAPILFVGSELSQRYLDPPGRLDVLRQLAVPNGLAFADDPNSADSDLSVQATTLAQTFDERWRRSHPDVSRRTARAMQSIDSESA